MPLVFVSVSYLKRLFSIVSIAKGENRNGGYSNHYLANIDYFSNKETPEIRYHRPPVSNQPHAMKSSSRAVFITY